jgi:hypothetical protein
LQITDTRIFPSKARLVYYHSAHRISFCSSLGFQRF